MPTTIIASAVPRVGRSLIAAATAARIAREGRAVVLARLSGDDGAADDAASDAASDASAFASLEGLRAPAGPVTAADVAGLPGDVVIEAPAGPVAALAQELGARVIVVGRADSPATDAGPSMVDATIITNVPASQVSGVAARAGVTSVLAEDRVLAAPSVAAIAEELGGEWLVRAETQTGIDRVMIGTVSSDAAEPYFSARERKCVITRYDKTDIQLAALFTDVELLVLTGGGAPSPYLLDRVQGTRDDISVLLVQTGTVDAMRRIEALYGAGRFDGAGKLERVLAMLGEPLTVSA